MRSGISANSAKYRLNITSTDGLAGHAIAALPTPMLNTQRGSLKVIHATYTTGWHLEYSQIKHLAVINSKDGYTSWSYSGYSTERTSVTSLCPRRIPRRPKQNTSFYGPSVGIISIRISPPEQLSWSAGDVFILTGPPEVLAQMYCRPSSSWPRDLRPDLGSSALLEFKSSSRDMSASWKIPSRT